ncbi:MAG: hypothetical protein OQK98_03215 [Gammaproteobacteria bacterium]|nr:hypothetical protein [Gammaproteobacteria bacterium]
MTSIITRFVKPLLASFVGGVLLISTAQAANYDSGIFEFQQKLADNGNPQAQYKLAAMYESGRGVAKDISKAKDWYQKAAVNNYKPAKHRLTYLEVKNSGFKASHKPWLKDLSADARKGDLEAMYMLGEMHENGIGVKKNLKQARSYYKAASTRGSVDAENRLYVVEEKLYKAKADRLAAKEAKLAAQEAEQKKKDAQARKAREAQKKNTESNKQKQAQIKEAKERNKLEMERRSLAEERRKLEAQQKALLEKEQAAKVAAREKEKKEPQGFESDLCSGRAARFRTQCK